MDLNSVRTQKSRTYDADQDEVKNGQFSWEHRMDAIERFHCIKYFFASDVSRQQLVWYLFCHLCYINMSCYSQILKHEEGFSRGFVTIHKIVHFFINKIHQNVFVLSNAGICYLNYTLLPKRWSNFDFVYSVFPVSKIKAFAAALWKSKHKVPASASRIIITTEEKQPWYLEPTKINFVCSSERN